MKKTLMLAAFGITLLIAACSNHQDEQQDNTSSVNYGTATTTTTIKAEFLKSANNKTAGNFTDIHFVVENYVDNILLQGPIECDANEQQIICEAKTDLRSLKPGIYRLLLKSKSGILGTDLFEIMPGVIPVVVTIDNESTGFYLISLITKATAIREDELYKRVRIILGGNPNQEYDLEPTLYDLFMYYKGYENTQQALKKMIAAIQADKPLANVHADGVAGALKPLY